MKINVIIPSFYPAVIYGGPIFTSLHTVEELSKLNIEIWVSTTNANMNTRLNIKSNIWHNYAENLHIKYYNETIINKISFSLLFKLWQDIRSCEIIHIQGLFSTPTPIALFYSKLFNKKVILTPHGTLGTWCLKEGSKFKNLWLNLLIKPFNNTILWHATAEMEKNEILQIFPEAKVKVIANGIKIDEFKEYNKLAPSQFLKKFVNKDSDIDKVIVSMGRLQKKKGFDILIDSFNIVIQTYPNAKLFIAGQDEGEKENLLLQINKLKLKESIFLVGPISGQDKVDFLANADLFCLPSHNENFGIVYAESLAAGTPIIASTNTPWNEVEDYNCGKWVENSIKETSIAINKILKQNREVLRNNSKKLALNYDWANIAVEFKNLFKEMVNNK